MDWFEEQCERCKACRYKNRGALDEPCSTGMYMIAYSRRCMAYKPSIMTMIREAVERLKGAVNRRTDGTAEKTEKTV